MASNLDQPTESTESVSRTLLALSIFPIQASRFIFKPSTTRERLYLALLVIHVLTIISLESDGPDQAYLCGFVITLIPIRLLPTLTWEDPPDKQDFRLKDLDPATAIAESIHDVTQPSGSPGRSWIRRFQWGLSWMTTLRGIGWNWQVRNIPSTPKEYTSRLHYLVNRIPMMFLYGFAVDCLWKMRGALEFTKYHGSLPGCGSSASQGFGLMVVNSLFAMSSMWFTTLYNYEMVAVVSTAVCIDKPEDWPPVIGSLADAYSLKRFWGRTWHQLFRNIFEKYGKAANQALHLRKWHPYSQIVSRTIAFLISGLIHTLPMLGMPYIRGIPKDKNTPFKGSDQIVFFGLHAILTVVEDRFWSFYSEVRNEGEIRSWERLVGYCWVLLCMVCTTRFIFDEMELSGLNDKAEIVPFSIVNLVKGLLA